MNRSISIEMSAFARDSLASGSENGSFDLSAKTTEALRYYLGDKDSGRIAWPCPAGMFEPQGGERAELNIDDALWGDLEAEARAQGVPAEELFRHAILYFAAELDSGRVTERLVDDLGTDPAL